jgi:predicted ester cyclase
MSTEENKAIVRRLIEAANAQDFDVFDQLMTPELAEHSKDVMRWVYASFEGHHFDITDMVAEGDKVMTRVTTRGSHSGEFEGVPRTGKQWTSKGFIYDRFENGKVGEVGWVMDWLDHLKQLGATITPPASFYTLARLAALSAYPYRQRKKHGLLKPCFFLRHGF